MMSYEHYPIPPTTATPRVLCVPAIQPASTHACAVVACVPR